MNDLVAERLVVHPLKLERIVFALGEKAGVEA